MTLLICGLLLFFAVHLIPHFSAARNALVARMGENPYKGVYSLLALAGIIMLVMGKGQAPYQHLYLLPGAAQLRHVTYLLVLLGCISLMAMFVPGNLRRLVHHPMLLGIALWGAGHLLVNGDLASVLLFGSFFVYASLSIIALLARGKRCTLPKQPVWKDGLTIVLGVALYVGLVIFHGHIAGIALISR